MNTARHHLRWRAHAACSALVLACAGLGAGAAAAFELEPDLRLHLDAGTHDSDARALDNGAIVRRATAGIEAKWNDDWSFEAAYEFASDGRLRPADGKFKDVALHWDGGTLGHWSAGQFKLPFGFDELTSSNDIIFAERALPLLAFAPSRRMGLGWSLRHDAWTLSAMGFGASIGGDDRGRGLALRATTAPLRSADALLHLGVAAVSEKPHGKVDFDAAPESRVPDVDLVNTGGIDAVERIDRIGLEAAWRAGPFSVQGEWLQASLRREVGWPDARLSGWYLAGSWLLTGESRAYKHGRFRGVTPARPTGAWELVARYSRLDLDDGAIRGGAERNVTFGVNYYLNKHVRVMFEHISVHSARRGRADNPRLWLLRLQARL